MGEHLLSLAGIRERVGLGLLRCAPKGAYANTVGLLARKELPRAWRRPLFESFARRVGANLDEVEKPLEEYPSMDAFFTRGLKPDARPIQRDDTAVLSPCDGTIQSFGIAHQGNLLQAKGQSYSLAGLLDDPAADRFHGGAYVTIYLSPRDYHRVHFATSGEVTGYHQIAGCLYPVNRFATGCVPGLFARNERLVTYQRSPLGEIATVMVAAVGVGNISVTYDPIETRRRKKRRPGERVQLSSTVVVGQGDELGTFHLGSTVVILFEPDRVDLLPLEEGAPVRLGSTIARRRGAHGRSGAAA